MPCFYMDLESGLARTVDDEGYYYGSIEDMRAEAILAAREPMSANILAGKPAPLDDCFLVRDETGCVVLTVAFKDALNGAPSPVAPLRSSQE